MILILGLICIAELGVVVWLVIWGKRYCEASAYWMARCDLWAEYCKCKARDMEISRTYEDWVRDYENQTKEK